MPLYIQINAALLGIATVLCILPELVRLLRKQLLMRKQGLPALPTENKQISFPGNADILWSHLFILLYSLLAISGLFSGRGDASEPSTDTYIVSLFINIGIYLPFIHRIIYVTRQGIAPGLGFHRISLVQLLRNNILYVIVIPLVISFVLENNGFDQWLHECTGTPCQQDIISVLINSDNLTVRICLIFLAVVVAPIAEECFFRGFLYNILKKSSGKVVAALLSSFLFAALHTSLVQFVPLFIFALLQCRLYEKSRTLVAPVTAHFLFNLIGSFFILLIVIVKASL